MVRLRKSVVRARPVGKPAARELVPTMPGTSARWHMHDYPGPYCRWHYHPEFEIHLIQHGTGRSIVGDHIGRFTAGHLVLVGSNLPHDWISDVGDGEHITNRDVVFQFHPQWIADCQQLLPELRAVDPLLARAARGIEFTGPTAAAAAPQLLAIGDSAGIDRLHHILALLDILSAATPEEAQPLASPWTPPQDKGGTDDLIDDALNYLFANSAREIRLADVAARAAMSESSFSRYFRRSAGQSFSDTVRKLRLAHACQLLENTDEPISTICHRTGYQNLSNFNRQFRQEYGITPGQYRRIHQHPELVYLPDPTRPNPNPEVPRRRHHHRRTTTGRFAPGDL